MAEKYSPLKKKMHKKPGTRLNEPISTGQSAKGGKCQNPKKSQIYKNDGKHDASDYSENDLIHVPLFKRTGTVVTPIYRQDKRRCNVLPSNNETFNYAVAENESPARSQKAKSYSNSSVNNQYYDLSTNCNQSWSPNYSSDLYPVSNNSLALTYPLLYPTSASRHNNSSVFSPGTDPWRRDTRTSFVSVQTPTVPFYNSASSPVLFNTSMDQLNSLFNLMILHKENFNTVPQYDVSHDPYNYYKSNPTTNITQNVPDANTKVEKTGDLLEKYLKLPLDMFVSPRRLDYDPNRMIDCFCRLENAPQEMEWVLDLEFGLPRQPTNRTLASYNTKINMIVCRKEPDISHPDFAKSNNFFKETVLFFYDGLISNWYLDYTRLYGDDSVANFQRWLTIVIDNLGLCWR